MAPAAQPGKRRAAGCQKYNFYTGAEQFFNLDSDPGETRDLAGDSARRATLASWRGRLTSHLAARGAAWVKDGLIQTRPRGTICGPNRTK
jgi:hypothetical protein